MVCGGAGEIAMAATTAQEQIVFSPSAGSRTLDLLRSPGSTRCTNNRRGPITIAIVIIISVVINRVFIRRRASIVRARVASPLGRSAYGK